MGELLKFDPIAQRLATVPARDRMDALISAEDARERVQAMDAFALYSLIREVGLGDALELVHLASAEQSQAFLDFDCWQRDHVDLDQLGDWLTILFQTDDESMATLHRELDPELLGYYLREHLKVYLYEDEDDADIIDTLDGPVESSPDGVYAILFPEDADIAAQARLILHRLYFDDHEEARRLLHAARWEMSSVLEDNAYRVRAGRLEQYGFLPVEEAVEIYAAVKPAAERRAAEQALAEPVAVEVVATPRAGEGVRAELPAGVARELEHVSGEGGSFFGRAFRAALSGQPDTVADGLVRQLATLVNTAVMADLVEPGDTDALPWVFRRAHGFLNLGLQYLTGASDDAARRLLLAWPLKRVLRTGYSLVARVAAQAVQLRARGNLTLVDELPYSLCADAESDLLDGLAQIRPLRSMTYSEGFEHLAEVEEAAASLALLAFKELWTFGWRQHHRNELAALFFGPPSAAVPIEAITFDSLLATHSAVACLSGAGHMRLLTAEELRLVIAEHITPYALSERFANALRDALRAPSAVAVEATARLAERWYDQIVAALTEEYGRLDASAAAEITALSPLLVAEEDADAAFRDVPSDDDTDETTP
jgi:hypothetical protein